MIGSSFFRKVHAATETITLVVAILATLFVGALNLILLAVRPHVSFLPPVSGRPTCHVAALGDLDGDGDLDALLGYRTAIEIWRNDGQAGFHDHGERMETLGLDPLALGDVDGDGDLDALVGAQVWLNNGSGRFRDRGPCLRPAAEEKRSGQHAAMPRNRR